MYTITISFFLNSKKIWIEVLSSELKSFDIFQKLFNKKLSFLDNITHIAVTKNYIIVVTSDRDFRYGAKTAPYEKEEREENNICAYDWNGNYLWNIADIVGDIKLSFDGGSVTNRELFEIPDFQSTSELDPSCEDHDLFSCIAGGHMFVIDLETRKIVGHFHGKW